MNEEFDSIIERMQIKESKELCREVMSITDTMDVLRGKCQRLLSSATSVTTYNTYF